MPGEEPAKLKAEEKLEFWLAFRATKEDFDLIKQLMKQEKLTLSEAIRKKIRRRETK